MWFFSLEVLILIVIALTTGVMLVIFAFQPKQRPALLIAAWGPFLLAAVMWLGIGQFAILLRDLDFQMSRPTLILLMEQHVDTRAAFSLGGGGYFFVRTTGFSPDPYCGYEFAVTPESVVEDPLGSGHGVAESLGDGWYWVCAT